MAILSANPAQRSFSRILKYFLFRGFTLFLTVLVSVYLMILIINLGGYLDVLSKAEISASINDMLSQGWLKGKPAEERQALIDQAQWEMEEANGLHEPFLIRSANWLVRGVTLRWGKARSSYLIAQGMDTTAVYSNDLKTLVLTFLPRTMLLLGVTYFSLFIISVMISLAIVRKPGGWIDRMLVSLAPLSSAPSWVFGILLYAFFIKGLGIYSFDLGVRHWPKILTPQYIPLIMRSLFLPFLAILLSKFFQSVYTWRTYFLIYSEENYMELARAKGLPAPLLERRYLIRPALPSLITSFVLIVITIWQECIAIEYFFRIEGIGDFFRQALSGSDVPALVALVVTFAYCLGISVLLLDIVYALVDPRVKIGEDQVSEKASDWSYNRKGAKDAKEEQRKNLILKKKTFFSSLCVLCAFAVHSLALLRSAYQSVSWGSAASLIKRTAAGLKTFLRELARYPSAVAGLALILVFTLLSILTLIRFPYKRAIALWSGVDPAWQTNPAAAGPAWTNWFRAEKLPENIVMNSAGKSGNRTALAGKETAQVTISFPFDYSYHASPQDVAIIFTPKYNEKNPFVVVTWHTPDGRTIPLKNLAVSQGSVYKVSSDAALAQKFRGSSPIEALFSNPKEEASGIISGRYTVEIRGTVFEKDSRLDAELVVFGRVYGVAGTDFQRRDLALVLLWGMVVALAFGILAAFGTTFGALFLSAAGVWFGGWVDWLVQRFTEINLILPLLPTSLLIFTLYSKSIWAILGVTVALSIFGSSIKIYRAMFLQLKASPYVEAAHTYGASGWRIIARYLIPPVRSMLVPQLVILVPSYVFYEATLAYLGISDPSLPTLGKLIESTISLSILFLPAHLVIEPLALLILLALGFALLGFALERMLHEKSGAQL